MTMKRVKFRMPLPVEPAGNAFAIMGLWTSAARKAGWTQAEIDAKLKEAMSGDYANLREVLAATTRAA